MIFCCVSQMGKGKTLFSTLYASEYSKDHPNNKIYANYNLKQIKNFIFSEFMILPISTLENCLIIADDFLNLKNLDNFISIISSLSRKKDIDIILTCQYYTMVPLLVRTLSIFVEVEYRNDSDTLYIRFTDINENQIFKKIDNAVERAKSFYDTNQVVKIATDDAILDEIRKMKLNKEDTITNLHYFFKSQSKIEKYKKYLGFASGK